MLVKEKANGLVSTYYVSKLLSRVEINYLKIEKYLYALVCLAHEASSLLPCVQHYIYHQPTP